MHKSVPHLNKHFKRNKNSWLGSASLHIITNNFCPLKWALVARTKSSLFILLVQCLTRSFVSGSIFGLAMEVPTKSLLLSAQPSFRLSRLKFKLALVFKAQSSGLGA